MHPYARSRINTQIYEEACAWFVECRAGDLDDSGRRAFDRWLRKSPEHLNSYLEVAAIWNEGPSLGSHSNWSADALIDRVVNADDDNVVSLGGVLSAGGQSEAGTALAVGFSVGTGYRDCRASSRVSSARPHERFGRSRRLAVAASIAALVVLAGSLSFVELSAPIYATTRGEQRSIQFDDGSTVDLNSSSKIRMTYSKQERDVELIEGQALFHVAHDASRPFIVAVGATRVRAVGTQFDVYKRTNGTVVTVVEGRVVVYSTPQRLLSEMRGAPSPRGPDQAPAASAGSAYPRRHSVVSSSTHSFVLGSSVSDPQRQTPGSNSPAQGTPEPSSFLLTAGEQLTLTTDAAQKTANPNIAGVTAWKEREIVFESATLSDVAEEFNRYNRRQLVIEDTELYGFHISGVFSSTDPDSLIKFLRQRPGVRVIEKSDVIRVERYGP